MCDLWVLIKRVLIIYESYDVFVCTMSEHLLRTNESIFLIPLRLSLCIVVLFCVCVCVYIFACTVGKACLRWLTNKIFEFEFEFEWRSLSCEQAPSASVDSFCTAFLTDSELPYNPREVIRHMKVIAAIMIVSLVTSLRINPYDLVTNMISLLFTYYLHLCNYM